MAQEIIVNNQEGLSVNEKSKLLRYPYYVKKGEKTYIKADSNCNNLLINYNQAFGNAYNSWNISGQPANVVAQRRAVLDAMDKQIKETGIMPDLAAHSWMNPDHIMHYRHLAACITFNKKQQQEQALKDAQAAAAAAEELERKRKEAEDANRRALQQQAAALAAYNMAGVPPIPQQRNAPPVVPDAGGMSSTTKIAMAIGVVVLLALLGYTVAVMA